MFVRHPLERILSAFYDKFRHQANYQAHYGRRIIQKYRGRNASSASRGHDVTLAEFVRFLLDPTISKQSRTGRPDIHWATQWELCRVCNIKYVFSTLHYFLLLCILEQGIHP